MAVWVRGGGASEDSDSLVGSARPELRDLTPGIVTNDRFSLRCPGLQGRDAGSAVRVLALGRPAGWAEGQTQSLPVSQAYI